MSLAIDFKFHDIINRVLLTIGSPLPMRMPGIGSESKKFKYWIMGLFWMLYNI